MRSRTTRRGAVGTALLLGLSALPAAGQARWTTHGEDRGCNGGGRDDDRWCEVRETTLPAPARLNVMGGDNGSIQIAGSARKDVHVLAHVWATARSEDRAK